MIARRRLPRLRRLGSDNLSDKQVAQPVVELLGVLLDPVFDHLRTVTEFGRLASSVDVSRILTRYQWTIVERRLREAAARC